MTSNAPPNYIVEHINAIAKLEGFSEFTVAFNAGSEFGDGMTGELLSAVVCGKREGDGSENRTKLHLVCKKAPESSNRRKELFLDILFGREVDFYTKVMPLLVEFQQSKCLPAADQFRAVPKCYAAIADEISEQYAIIMADLRSEGFAMRPKTEPIPIENHRVIMRELGKFHAISFALKDQRCDVFEKLKKFTDIARMYFEAPSTRNVFIASIERAMSSLKRSEHKNIYDEVKRNVIAYLDCTLNEESARRFGVLSHGDCWNNNFLYRRRGVSKSDIEFECINHCEHLAFSLLRAIWKCVFSIGSTCDTFRPPLTCCTTFSCQLINRRVQPSTSPS